MEDECEQSVMEYIAEGKSSLNIVVCGKMGTGKSSLVNGIVGKEVAVETTDPLSATPKIEQFHAKLEISDETTRKTIDVTLGDTPGLGDAFGSDSDILDNIAKECKTADLIIYCMNIRDRMVGSDTKGMIELTKRVGPDIWSNTVIALTFANEVKPAAKFNYTDLVTKWEDAIADILRNTAAVPEDVVKDIAIVPTGYREIPPPDQKDWFSPFWFEAFRKTKDDAKPALLGINLHRFQMKSPYDERQTDARCDKQKEAYEQAIFIDRFTIPKEAKRKIAGGTLAGLGGGALLGALVGIAGGPAGLAAGAVVGGALGSAVGAFAGALVVAVKKRMDAKKQMKEQTDHIKLPL